MSVEIVANCEELSFNHHIMEEGVGTRTEDREAGDLISHPGSSTSWPRPLGKQVALLSLRVSDTWPEHQMNSEGERACEKESPTPLSLEIPLGQE